MLMEPLKRIRFLAATTRELEEWYLQFVFLLIGLIQSYYEVLYGNAYLSRVNAKFEKDMMTGLLVYPLMITGWNVCIKFHLVNDLTCVQHQER